MKLEVKNLHKSFGETEVLHGISFSVEEWTGSRPPGPERSRKDYDHPDPDAGLWGK